VYNITESMVTQQMSSILFHNLFFSIKEITKLN